MFFILKIHIRLFIKCPHDATIHSHFWCMSPNFCCPDKHFTKVLTNSKIIVFVFAIFRLYWIVSLNLSINIHQVVSLYPNPSFIHPPYCTTLRVAILLHLKKRIIWDDGSPCLETNVHRIVYRAKGRKSPREYEDSKGKTSHKFVSLQSQMWQCLHECCILDQSLLSCWREREMNAKMWDASHGHWLISYKTQHVFDLRLHVEFYLEPTLQKEAFTPLASWSIQGEWHSHLHWCKNTNIFIFFSFLGQVILPSLGSPLYVLHKKNPLYIK